MSNNKQTQESLKKLLEKWKENVETFYIDDVRGIPRNENQKDDVIKEEVNHYSESLDEIKRQGDQNSIKIEQTNTKVEYAIGAIIVGIISILVSHFLLWPGYQNEYRKEISELKNEYRKEISELKNEYRKEISELKNEYNSKILEQQNTINLQQEKIQNLEDDIKELKDIIKKYFIK